MYQGCEVLYVSPRACGLTPPQAQRRHGFSSVRFGIGHTRLAVNIIRNTQRCHTEMLHTETDMGKARCGLYNKEKVDKNENSKS